MMKGSRRPWVKSRFLFSSLCTPILAWITLSIIRQNGMCSGFCPFSRESSGDAVLLFSVP